MQHRPTLAEDAKNLAVIGGSALAGIVATMALANPGYQTGPGPGAEAVPAAPARTYDLVEPLSGVNRLYGTVQTRDGRTHTGFLRWDRNEASWGDLLDLTRIDRGESGLAGVRFGHVEHILATGRNQAVFAFRSGEQATMRGQSSDLGPGMRSLVVTTPLVEGSPAATSDAAGGRGAAETKLEWSDIRQVTFQDAPADARPRGGRLHGTLTTTSGMAFTGFITWDVDEVFSTDMLDGETSAYEYEIPFGAIEEINRNNRRSADVLLHSGERLTLSGTNDVNRSNRGITVSDPALGQVKVRWDALADVRFHGTPSEESRSDFNGGEPLRGTVWTASGDELAGTITWDRDETRSWEMLNGEADRVEFDIEFSMIARIEKNDRGSTVVLRDGRSFDLDGSNDVGRGNRGVVVTAEGQTYTVRWADFRELRLDW
ncbi:MAG: hypothetical protein OXN18_13370 [Gemmatimonadota bacterium]|nr:hypothetical protein [Gemmatimonadota bacterium]